MRSSGQLSVARHRRGLLHAYGLVSRHALTFALLLGCWLSPVADQSAHCAADAQAAEKTADDASEDDDEEDDGPRLIAGLVARYESAGGPACVRRDEAIQFDWKGQAPDERLGGGAFSAQWQGLLTALTAGEYRFYIYAAGETTLRLNDSTLISATGDEPGWHESQPVELPYGPHRLSVAFRSTGENAQLRLYWSGPRFALEPVPPRVLFHDPADTPDDSFQRGAELWRALRCANCHRGGDQSAAARGPDLTHLAGNLQRRWLTEWLTRGGAEAHLAKPSVDGEPDEPVRMPAFGLSKSEAEAIAAYLFTASRPAPVESERPGNAPRGQELFVTLGCLACHQWKGLGTAGLFSGGDLTLVADKRPPGFFGRWLAEPGGVNSAHRMPVFQLAADELADLAAFLGQRGTPDRTESELASAAGPDLVASGRRLVAELRCGACHALPDAQAVAPVVWRRPAGALDWSRGCLAEPDRAHARPGYQLDQADRRALAVFVASRPRDAQAPAIDGREVLRERQCLACHARDAAAGIAARLPALVERFPDLAPRLPKLAPPSLTSVGDKLHDRALADAIALRRPPLRPWLAARMPRFDLSPAEFEALLDYLTTSDRIADRPAADVLASPTELEHAGSRLVTATGFGCTSCHAIGHWRPVNVALAAQGTDLSRLGQRIRRAWFDRWVRNPARIVPRMEMPAIQMPASNVLGQDLDRQLAAVWHVLNLPDFEPPRPGPIRTARHRGDGPPVVITDVVELPGQTPRTMLRPLIVGLPNRHNLLFDLSRNQLAGWWLGDTARQHTRGKSWYWEPAGSDLLPPLEALSAELVLVSGQRQLAELPCEGPGLAELDWYESTAGGVRFGYRLRFVGDAGPLTVRVEQRLTAIADAEAHGFRRRIEIRGAESCQARLRLLPGDESMLAENGDLQLVRDPRISIRPRLPARATIEVGAEGCQATLAPDEQGGLLVFEADYLTQIAPDPPPPAGDGEADDDWSGDDRRSMAAKLPVVPGFDAERLPLPRREMPTGLTWLADGTLAFCSLKGGVWLADDSDGDGLEDRLRRVADGLPAPYGIASHAGALDVCAKYGVVRIDKLDTAGRAARAEVVASGWGYSADYHDWTVGLPRDRQGDYYVALPCQQDERSLPEAYLRGTVVRLRSRKPSEENPRRYALDPISAGLRFPMGLALDRQGDLFATDNQGNYTPFNELNHVRPGRRYGFINRLEAKPGFQPPFDNPAIAVPHPWTRSVNGVCFLDAPAGEWTADERFGPFAGQLIGCEYDTRRLVRLSVERVGDTFQGAVYPFSDEPEAGQETFEGPVVCAVSPAGDLYVGNLRDSGWGGGQNTGSIVRLRRCGELPPGIAEVRSRADGFEIKFTQAVSPARAGDATNYAISSYRRLVTPAYGGPDVDRREEAIESIEVADDARSVRLRLRSLRAGFVYEFQLRDLAGAGQRFFPAEAYYTLR
jgi:mono/diheme cytochrome c family protein